MVSPFLCIHETVPLALAMERDRAPYASFVLGIQLCMYGCCARYLWSQRNTRRNALFTLAYITVIFVIATMFVGVQARMVQLGYVDNRVSPSTPSSSAIEAHSSVSVTSIMVAYECAELSWGTIAILPCHSKSAGPYYFLCLAGHDHLPLRLPCGEQRGLVRCSTTDLTLTRSLPALAMLDHLERAGKTSCVYRLLLPDAHAYRLFW